MVRGGESAVGERDRGAGKQKLQTMSIYNADAVYVSKQAWKDCIQVCVYVVVCQEGFVKAHESF